MKKIGVIVILAVLVFVTGCSNQPSATEEAQPSNEVFSTPIATPTHSPPPTPTTPQFYSFDADYQNLSSENYEIIVLGNNFNQITIDFGGGLVGIWGENEKAGLIDSDIRSPRIMDIPSDVNIYKAEVIDGKLHFTLLYQEFEPEE